MKLSTVILAIFSLTIAVSLSCIWVFPSLKDFMYYNTLWNGMRKFSDEFKAIEVNSLGDVSQPPEKSLILEIPNINYNEADIELLRQFIEDGGCILLMDDYNYGNTILEYFGLEARFSNNPILDPLFCYKEGNMPKITDFNGNITASGIDVIVLNHSSSLMGVTDEQKLAWSSPTSFMDENNNGGREEKEPFGPFPVAAELKLGKGYVFLVSDSSMLINSMFGMYKNEQFIQYLVTSKGVDRTIFVDNSHIAKSPLDLAKEKMQTVREVLANPYVLLGIIAVIFAIVFRYTFKKGESVA